MPRCVVASVLAALLVLLPACQRPEAFSLPVEKYVLPNGLNVILHRDPSDPIAAVAMTFHVGSAREVAGKTGFAHLFEHLFFLDSEHLGYGGLDRLMTRIGSSTNGSTSHDRTNYFEVVPVDGLEKALWAESDKLGYFINTVTESVLAKEKQVVKNEKRQSVDNRPYGHTDFVIDEALYPEDHPYHWQVIGSLADLDAATLADVRAFHKSWYGPNNATLVVAGDLDVEQTRAWIEKYFGEIPAVDLPTLPKPAPVTLDATVRLFHEDPFARAPEFTLAWPSVGIFHPDSYALDVLAELLTEGKTAPFYEVVVKEEKLAPNVSAYQNSDELAGRFTLSVRAFSDTPLDSVAAATQVAFARFEERGVSSADLERVKARFETGFYDGLGSVLGKAFRFARYNLFAGSPDFLAEDLRRLQSVSAADVQRVYDRYLRDRPFVMTSFVPKGQAALAVAGSVRANVVEEPIVAGAEDEVAVGDRGTIVATPSGIDRSVEPPFGEPPVLSAPPVWQTRMENGLPVYGIVDREVPLVRFELRLRGGHIVETPEQAGVANLLAETMTEGTARRTPEELEMAIESLGANVSVRSGSETFTIQGSTLARNYAETMRLVEEMVLEPRFDEEAFALARQRVLGGLQQRPANPDAVANDAFARLIYGPHPLGSLPAGTAESVGALTIEDLRAYYRSNIVAPAAVFHVVGAVMPEAAKSSLGRLGTEWGGTAPLLPDPPVVDAHAAGLFFVDVPGAKQSVLRIGFLAVPETDPSFYPATIMNFRLGGGGFASELTQVLREENGYTYGVRSAFIGSVYPGPFEISTSVRSNITLEALTLIRDIVEGHGPGFDEADLQTTRGFLLRADARAFETLGDKLDMLSDMSRYGFPFDYILRREQIIRDISVTEIRSLADRFLHADRMVWLVVGDARTQLPRLGSLGLGPVTMLDRAGLPLRQAHIPFITSIAP